MKNAIDSRIGLENVLKVPSLNALFVVRLLCTPKRGHLRRQCSSANADAPGNCAGKPIQCGIIGVRAVFWLVSMCEGQSVFDKKFNVQADKAEEVRQQQDKFTIFLKERSLKPSLDEESREGKSKVLRTNKWMMTNKEEFREKEALG